MISSSSASSAKRGVHSTPRYPNSPTVTLCPVLDQRQGSWRSSKLPGIKSTFITRPLRSRFDAPPPGWMDDLTVSTQD